MQASHVLVSRDPVPAVPNAKSSGSVISTSLFKMPCDACIEAIALAASQVQNLVQASDTDASLSTSLPSGVFNGHHHIS